MASCFRLACNMGIPQGDAVGERMALPLLYGRPPTELGRSGSFRKFFQPPVQSQLPRGEMTLGSLVCHCQLLVCHCTNQTGLRKVCGDFFVGGASHWNRGKHRSGLLANLWWLMACRARTNYLFLFLSAAVLICSAPVRGAHPRASIPAIRASSTAHGESEMATSAATRNTGVLGGLGPRASGEEYPLWATFSWTVEFLPRRELCPDASLLYRCTKERIRFLFGWALVSSSESYLGPLRCYCRSAPLIQNTTP